HLVDDEARRAVGIDQILAIDAGGAAEVGWLAARVDHLRKDVAQEYPAVVAGILREVAARTDVLDVSDAVALGDEEADVGIAAERERRLAAGDDAAQLADLFLQLLVVLVLERRGLRGL